jgi:hypothetical protein
MDLVLTRLERQSQGVFSKLEGGTSTLYACEHAYQDPAGNWFAKIANGIYVCVAGMHTLDGVHWFRTYEVTGVVGHSGILFHSGNTEMDSDGCILLGLGFGTLNGMKDVYSSAVAFQAFSNMQAGVNSFTLTVQ